MKNQPYIIYLSIGHNCIENISGNLPIEGYSDVFHNIINEQKAQQREKEKKRRERKREEEKRRKKEKEEESKKEAIRTGQRKKERNNIKEDSEVCV